ncbi:MAG TPA: ATP-binding protein [Mycobacteriales bacterium]|nr:ATP-binding protein [Mycobacteriales bacterium]
MEVGHAQVDVRLPPVPDSTGRARSAVRRALTDWRLDHLVDTTTLLVSELTTNVVLHARTDFEVQVERRADVVRVTVLDGSSGRAVRRRYGVEAGTGRGLGLVETLSVAWGCSPGRGEWSKAVWFEVPVDGSETPGEEGALYGEDWLALVDEL